MHNSAQRSSPVMTVPHTISAMVSVVALAQTAMWGLAQTANIVGLGATPCGAFNRDVERNFQIQRDYFAWVQGFMSGILMRAPPGIDEGLQLTLPNFPCSSRSGSCEDAARKIRKRITAMA